MARQSGTTRKHFPTPVSHFGTEVRSSRYSESASVLQLSPILRGISVRVAAILLLLLPLLAQEQVPTKGAGDKAEPASIAGMVVRADTGEPLKKATLSLSNEDSETRYLSRTDSEGRFLIANLAPGRYNLWASCQGYVSTAYGAKSTRRQAPPVVLEKGQELRGILIRLQRTAVIAGRVLDENGDPVQGATVSAQSYYGRGKNRQLRERESAQTSDLGEYRIFGLEPGKYFLRAAPSQDYYGAWAILRMPERARDPKQQSEPVFVYPPIFYPAATNISEASRIELKPGDEFRADFAFAPVSAFSVSGHVVGALSKSRDALVVTLSPKNENGSNQQATRVGKDGSYEITDVLPGSYNLLISVAEDYYSSSQQMAVKRAIEVTNNDLDNVDLVLPVASKIEIRGRLNIEGEVTPNFQRFGVQLTPSDGDDNDASAWKYSQVSSDGTFSFQQISPGTYFIEASDRSPTVRRGYYLKSARYGTRDVTDSGLTVTEGTQPRLDVVLGFSSLRIEGVVVDDKGLPVGGAAVVAMPRDSTRANLYRSRGATTDKNGGFVISNVRPGEYKLLAFDNADYADYSDPEFVQQHDSASVTAQAQPGNSAKVKLKLISLDEDRQQDGE